MDMNIHSPRIRKLTFASKHFLYLLFSSVHIYFAFFYLLKSEKKEAASKIIHLERKHRKTDSSERTAESSQESP